jgi:hypothetical protein
VDVGGADDVFSNGLVDGVPVAVGAAFLGVAEGRSWSKPETRSLPGCLGSVKDTLAAATSTAADSPSSGRRR